MKTRISMVLTVISGFFSSICCIGPKIFIPLGLGGVFNILNANIARYGQYFGWLTYLMIFWTGWQVYTSPSGVKTKIIYWIVVLISIGLINYLNLSNWFLKTFIY